MAIDSDEPISLPRPPPPRPAARQAAIEAALRKFDGAEEAPSKTASKGRLWTGWVAMDRRATGALATAALIAAVSIPLALTTLRETAPPSEASPAEAPAQTEAVEDPAACAGEACNSADSRGAEEDSPAPAPEIASRERPTRSLPALVPAPSERAASPADEIGAAQALPAPAAAPPPPPPAPPPAPEAQFAEEVSADSVVVSGSRVSRQNMAKQGPTGAVSERREEAPNALAVIDPHGDFLSDLQAAFRTNNRLAILNLVALPLRVRSEGQTTIYRSSRDVERDYDRIFTSQVRQSVLGQQPDTLRSRGRMRGTSRLWFGASSRDGPVRIVEVSP